MEIATAATGEATKCALAHVQREISYLVHFRRNTNNLEQKLEQLKAIRNDVERKIDTARNKSELIGEAVETWLKRVKIIEDGTAQLINEARKINNWFKGWCCCSRFSLGRKAEKKIADIQSVLVERSTFGDIVSDSMPIQSMEPVPMGDLEAFAFRETTMNQVLKALQDDKVIRVGVYGMGGVGKTTLVNALAIHMKREKIFNGVAVVTVSQNPDLKGIQGEVAKKLDLELKEEDSVSIRAIILQEKFKISNNILVILDNMWERLDLAEMGIPLRNGSKLLLTTRSRDVCNAMETQVTIEVKVLLEEESWRLFRQKAGDVINSLDDQKVARDIVNECKGLPLAIVTLGRALRNKEYGVWVDALAQMKKSIFDGMEPVVSSIKLSYSYLPGERERLCFLFCCLFPEGSMIEMNVLLSYVIGERILRDVGTLEEARGRLRFTIVERLVSSCLLMEDEGGNIKMHDVVRDVAISIASEAGNGFIVKANLSFAAHWRDMQLDQCKRMSLMTSSKIVCSLPNQIKALQLLTFSLRNVSGLEEIPSDFFQETKNLLNLDLSGTSIKSLPSSISFLVNLRTLRLRSCKRLENASPVEKLENLEILSLKGTPLRHFSGVGKVSNLRAFDFSFPPHHNNSLPDISSLAQLEKLCVTDINNSRGINLLNEVASLTHLGTLKLSGMPNILLLDIPNQRMESLERFTIIFDSENDWWKKRVLGFPSRVFYLVKRNYKRNLFLETIRSAPVANWITTLLGRAECLFLENCKGFESVVVHLDPRGMDTNLKFLSVFKCTDLKYLISTIGVEEGPTHAFSCLEKLYLQDLSKFEAICHGGVLPQGFLYKLKVLSVAYCYQLILLLPSYLLVRLQNLESLAVFNCTKLEKIVQFEEKDNRVSLINNTPSGAASSSSSIGTISCQPEPPAFPNLGIIFISNCPKLKCVLPERVFRQLLQLKQLRVSYCEQIEVIMETETEEKDKTILTLPLLSVFKIVDLPNLSSFGRPGLLARWPSLEYLKVLECDSLRKLPFDYVSVPKLKKLKVEDQWFDGLEWDDESLKPCLQALLPVKD